MSTIPILMEMKFEFEFEFDRKVGCDIICKGGGGKEGFLTYK